MPSMTPPSSSQIYDFLFFNYGYYTYETYWVHAVSLNVHVFRSDHLGLDKLLELFCPWKKLAVPLLAAIGCL